MIILSTDSPSQNNVSEKTYPFINIGCKDSQVGDLNSPAMSTLKESITYLQFNRAHYTIKRIQHHRISYIVFRISYWYRDIDRLPILQKYFEDCVVCDEYIDDVALKSSIAKTPDNLAHAVWSQTDRERSL